jgi:hypothetical protein
MATYQSIFPPKNERNVQISVNATTASSDIIIGYSGSATIFAITASALCTIRFGNAANIGNPDGTDFPIYASTIQEWQVPTGCDRFRVFNTTASTCTVNYWQLAKS